MTGAAATPGPLTLGTAGHVDHGKTALVAALTGVDTDRLPQERARGLTIELGYAPLRLPSGRALSVVDVPGHERFVRTMVAGATGIDAFLMTVAADDGVMPQTREHAAVLRALGIGAGVVAVTKADLADPTRAADEARTLLPGCLVVACSARTGAGLEAVVGALDRLVAALPSRAHAPGPARLHVDRAFTVVGHGTVVTGTLWSGAIGVGDVVEVAPRGTAVRVRSVEVHGRAVARARAGQRVAVNVVGVKPRAVARGDALVEPGAVAERTVLDCALALEGARHGERVQVHHGTRDVPGRASELADGLWQLRLERPLLARDGDRVVVRRHAPPDTLGGGVVLDAAARRHGRRAEIVARLRGLREGGEGGGTAGGRRVRAGGGAAGAPRVGARGAADGRPGGETGARRMGGGPHGGGAGGGGARDRAGGDLDGAARALERRLADAGAGLLSEAQIGDERAALRALRESGRAVRVSGRLYAHADVLAQTDARIVALLARERSATLADVRDALALSRKSAQAFLEHLDAARVTRRLPDDRRVLVRPAGSEGGSGP